MFSQCNAIHILTLLLSGLADKAQYMPLASLHTSSTSCSYRKRSRQDFRQLPGPPAHPRHSAPSTALSAKAERRRFMSGKAADVHRTATPQAQPDKRRRVSGQSTGSGLTREDFLNMQREVQTFGQHCCPILCFCYSYVKFQASKAFLTNSCL